MDLIPYGRQWIDDDDIEAVVKTLRSDWLTQGPMVEQFEADLTEYCGAKYAVAVSSGTAALHLAALAAEVSSGDNVVTSPITFVASANCAIYAGGTPRFVDIDSGTLNIAVPELDSFLARERVKAVIPVHFTGLPCDMEEIAELARRHDFTVIEDACHALGAQYRDSSGEWIKVGACRHADMTVFSFHPVKHITTGEGGAITTNSEILYEKLKMLRMHGITKDPKQLKKNDGPWYYEMQALGFNYRITDIQCALGSSQLKKMDGWIERRKQIVRAYDSAFSDDGAISIPRRGEGKESAHHLYVIQVGNRKHVFNEFRNRGLGVQVHYIPVHLQPFYKEQYEYEEGAFPKSEAYYKQCISLPIYPKMTDDEVQTVIDIVLQVTGARAK